MAALHFRAIGCSVVCCIHNSEQCTLRWCSLYSEQCRVQGTPECSSGGLDGAPGDRFLTETNISQANPGPVVQYTTVQYTNVQYNTVQCSSGLYYILVYCTICYCTVQYATVLYILILKHTLHCWPTAQLELVQCFVWSTSHYCVI